MHKDALSVDHSLFLIKRSSIFLVSHLDLRHFLLVMHSMLTQPRWFCLVSNLKGIDSMPLSLF